MALNKTAFKASIKAIFDALKTYDGSTGQEMDDAIEKLAEDLSNEIDSYIRSATVTASGTLTPGSLVSAAPGAPTVHVPPTGAPVSVTGSLS